MMKKKKTLKFCLKETHFSLTEMQRVRKEDGKRYFKKMVSKEEGKSSEAILTSGKKVDLKIKREDH